MRSVGQGEKKTIGRRSRCAIYARDDDFNPGRKRWIARCYICCPQFASDKTAWEKGFYECAKWIHARMWFVVHCGWHNRNNVSTDLVMNSDECESQQFRNAA